MKLKTVKEIAPLGGKKILLRAGFDVPLKDGKIVDDFRIKQTVPTIEYLLSKAVAEITVITHLGRPGGKRVKSLSVEPLRKYFFSNYPQWGKKLKIAENLRFDIREEQGDLKFAKELAAGKDFFVQDAFNNLHRRHASMVGIPRFLPSCIGLLVEKEIANLEKLLVDAEKPFIVVIGGKKIKTKVPLIENMKQKAELILVGGAVANEAKAQNLYRNDKKVVLPLDGVRGADGKEYDIGDRTIKLFKERLRTAKTVFWNGNLGRTEIPKYLKGSREIGKFIASLDAFTVIGGGDTAFLAKRIGVADRMDFISTGGGAALEFLSGRELPGLIALAG